MFEREERFEKKKESEPHPQARRNLETAFEYLKNITHKKDLSIVYQDFDPITSIINEPKFVAFYWKDGPRNYGHPISFHQSMENFSEELKKCINFIINRGLAVRDNPPTRTKDFFN